MGFLGDIAQSCELVRFGLLPYPTLYILRLFILDIYEVGVYGVLVLLFLQNRCKEKTDAVR